LEIDMPWGSIAAAVAPSVVGGLLGGSSSGGGQQTVNRDPWAPAQDWLKSNIASGQNLQNQYMTNPFSAYQQQAYGSSQQLSENARAVLGNLIPQMNGFTGFDRNNPTARPTGFSFGGNPQTPQNLALGFGPSVNSAAAMQPVAQQPQSTFATDMAAYNAQQAEKLKAERQAAGLQRG
jgi:hypothetical protein